MKKLKNVLSFVIPFIIAAIMFLISKSLVDSGKIGNETVYYVANTIYAPIICFFTLIVLIIIAIVFIFVTLLHNAFSSVLSYLLLKGYNKLLSLFKVLWIPILALILDIWLFKSGIISINEYDLSNPDFVNMLNQEIDLDRKLFSVTAFILTFVVLEIVGFIYRLILNRRQSI